MNSKQFSLLTWAACCSMLASVPTMANADTKNKSVQHIDKLPVSKMVVPDFSKPRAIAEVATVSVDCPQGTAPRLPYCVWVTYTDGVSEFRQVRWSNSPLADEQVEADAKQHPAGSQYEVAGYIIGDETTENGYPIKAQVKVVSGSYATPKSEVAHTLPLSDVTIDEIGRAHV